jgi:hypothetical protein
MKMTVILEDGKLVGATYGAHPQPSITEGPQADTGWRAGPLAGPGQELHVIDVTDEIMQITSAGDFHAKLESELRKVRK